MTIEVDILVGRTNNYMRYLDLNTGKPGEVAEKNAPGKHEQLPAGFLIDQGIDVHSIESNFEKITAIEAKLDHFIEVFSKGDGNDLDETIQDSQRLRSIENYERFGLQLFRKDHLKQYMAYLKGLQREYEIGDFYGAKQFYIDSLVQTVYVNHRIRRATLQHIMGINKRIGFPRDSPEKQLISRYYVK